METLKKRSEMPAADTWALEDIFESPEHWESECAALQELCKELQTYRGRLGESAQVMREFYEKKEQASKYAERLIEYAYMKLDENLGNNENQSRVGRADAVQVAFSQAVSFEEPELLALGEEAIDAFMNEEGALALRKTYFNRIFRTKDHILSPELEELLAKAGDVTSAASDVFTIFNNADLKFPSIQDSEGNTLAVTHGRYGMLMESKDRAVRKAAFASVYGMYEKYLNTIATVFMANLKQERFYAEARHFSSARAMELSYGNIPESVYDNLIDAIHDALPAFHRYVGLRKRILGVDELHMYDVYVPLVESVEKEYSFDEAKELVLKGLAPMGESYLEKLRIGFENRWIDVYENEGKRSGAYSWGPNGTHPYVLLNYQGNLDNVFTLAHEMGHALHSYHSDAAQPYTYAGYLIFVAEVASTCNEALLMNYMLSHASSKEEKRYLVNQFLEQFKGTMFRQTMFAEFERAVHARVGAGESLSASDFNAIYLDLNKTYFGPEMVSDDAIAFEWAKIPHFYTPFYVYQYATGFAAAIALSKRILTLGEAGVADYMKFLTGGCSKDPIELLRMAGVDMETKEPVTQALQMFADLVDELESLL